MFLEQNKTIVSNTSVKTKTFLNFCKIFKYTSQGNLVTAENLGKNKFQSINSMPRISKTTLNMSWSAFIESQDWFYWNIHSFYIKLTHIWLFILR